MHKKISVKDIFIDLISSGINLIPLDDTARSIITEDIYEELYELGEKHHVTHIVADVLLREKIVEDESFVTLLRANIISSINKTEKICNTFKKLCDTFEQACIAFVPLKGSVIREWYPKDWYRSSSDIDILVKMEDFLKAEKLLVEILECKIYKKGPHDVCYIAKNKVNIELHFALVESDGESVGKDYRHWNVHRLDSVWSRTMPREECTYQGMLTNEDFYLFHIAHMAKHFENGGCGVRSIIDLYLMDKMGMYDENVKKALDESKLLRFANVTRTLSQIWFDNGEHDQVSILAGDFILNGGVFGTPESKAKFGKLKKGSIGYILSRIFIPYRVLKTVYPVLKNHKMLYPFLLIVRCVRCLSPKTRSRVVNEIKTTSDRMKLSNLIEQLKL